MADRSGSRAGQQFGNYRLVRFLGQGGFAEVYLGQHVFLNTQAAIKVLRTQLAHEEQTSFLNEARTIAHLAHPNIIRVLDFGMQNDIPFLVMDYAPNGSLRERYPRGSRLPLDAIIIYVRQIASALQYAHQEKLVHRDVKPENMLVGRSGEVLLSDFGISIVAQTSRYQSTEEVIGSAPYMAPEQLQGKPRFASDQYALAIVVYEWLCGDRPFQGSFTELYGQHIFVPPPPLHEKDPALSPAIEHVVMTALAKDPHQRFSDIWTFASALEQAYRTGRAAFGVPAFHMQATFAAAPSPSIHDQTTAASSSPSPTSPHAQATLSASSLAPTYVPVGSVAPTVPVGSAAPTDKAPGRAVSRRTVLFGLAALVVAGGGGAAGWYALSHRYPPQGTLLYTYPLHNDTVYALAWHGERIASGGADQTVQIWDATTGNNPHVYRNHKDTINSVAWSPDGTRVASASDDGTVQVWDASAATPLLTYKGHMQGGNNNVYAVAWSPDGAHLASGASDGTIQVWDASTGRTIVTYKGHISNGSTSTIYSVFWSPDGTRIASGGDDNTAQIWDALTGKHAYIYKGHQNTVYSVAWSPDGTRLASGSADQTVQVWDPEAKGQPLTYSGHIDTVTSVSWSSNGQYLASASKDKTVRVWSVTDATHLYIYKRHSAAVEVVAWGDSHRLASGSDDKTVQVWEGV
jgi:serine/threonine protein kinase